METLTIRTANDSTGAKISSTKPVNVITGCTCSNVPKDMRYCDPIYDSPMPTNVWGNRFIIPPMVPRTGFVVRILAETKQTSITLTYSTGTTHRSVQFEGMYEIQLGKSTAVVTTDKRVSVMQYAVGKLFDGTGGDPFMTTVPSIKHFSNDYIFPPSLFEKWNFTIRIAITIESQYLNELKLDERNITSLDDIRSLSVPAPFSHYSVVVINLLPGNHYLKHPSSAVKFSVLYYGFEHRHSFGLYLGYSYDITECESSPCQNGATCIDGTHGYTCSCLPGYSEENCEMVEDECILYPCKNNATCIDKVNGFECTCHPGYSGNNCETGSKDEPGEEYSIYIVVGGVVLGLIIIALVVYAIYFKKCHKRRPQEIIPPVQPVQMEKETEARQGNLVYVNQIHIDTEERKGNHTPENVPSAKEDVGTEKEYFSILAESNSEENVYETIQ